MSGIRARLTSAFVLVAVVVVAVVSLVVYDTSASRRAQDLDDAAAARAREAATSYAQGGSLPPGARIIAGGLPQAGNPSEEPTPAPSPQPGPGARAEATVEDRDGVRTTVEVFVSGRADQRALADLRARLLGVSAAVVLAMAALGYLLAGLLSRRLRRAAEVARRIAEGDLDARTHLTGRDEVGQLGRVVDAMAASVADRIERERRFSADVAHELRTPVTGLVAASHLLPDDEVSMLVKQQSDALSRLVEDLLEVSRLESGTESAQEEDVDVAALCRAATRHCADEVEVVGAATIRTDARRLRRIVTNLVANALVHGRAPVRVEIEPSGLAVVDHGDGFDDAILPAATDRFVTSGRGSGLGLSIVAGQATVLGATLTVGNDATTGGGRAEVSWDDGTSSRTRHESVSES